MNENKVNGFFVAPTALRAIKLADPQTIEGKKYNIDRYVSVDFRDIIGRYLLWSRACHTTSNLPILKTR